MHHKVILTADGSKTVFVPEMDEQYHSLNGAQTESEYVFIEKGYLHHKSTSPVIFEVGFGTGLNALLTAQMAEKQKRPTTFVSIEKYPLQTKTVEELKYGERISESNSQLFSKIHKAEWNTPQKISEYFTLLKIEDDLKTYTFSKKHNFDIIYFDAFGPDKQANMWTRDIFSRIYAVSAVNAVFVTYSAKGEIRRQLRDCGFTMERLPGPPGKREMLRGIKF